MWRSLIAVLMITSLPTSINSQFANDMAQDIFKLVHNSIQNTQNQIAENMKNTFNMAGFPFGNGNMFNPTDLGSQINANVQNMGLQINNQIQKQLMPVQAKLIRSKMANGVGGTTVVHYNGRNPEILVIKNGLRYTCQGRIIGSQCMGTLEPFDYRTNKDLCLAKGYASVNNKICLSAGRLNIESSNNFLRCYTTDGSPTLILNRQEYRDLCGSCMPWEARYAYNPSSGHPSAVPIPNSNSYINCLNHQPGVCEFEGSQELRENGGGSYVSSSKGYNNNYQSF